MTKKLIMFEGIDCCGKDTQIEMLTEYLKLKGKSTRWLIIQSRRDTEIVLSAY